MHVKVHPFALRLHLNFISREYRGLFFVTLFKGSEQFCNISFFRENACTYKRVLINPPFFSLLFWIKTHCSHDRILNCATLALRWQKLLAWILVILTFRLEYLSRWYKFFPLNRLAIASEMEIPQMKLYIKFLSPNAFKYSFTAFTFWNYGVYHWPPCTSQN